MKVTTRNSLAAWLEELSRNTMLIAPVAMEEQIAYKPVAGYGEIVLDYGKTDLPAKEHFLPSTQALFSVQAGEGGVRIEEPSINGRRVLFGLRPCDARALRILDALFLEEEPIDPYYAELREMTTLIGLACREMGDECFCTSLGLAPNDARDVDLLLTEMDGGYAVQVGTEKGRAVLGGLALQDVEGIPPEPTTHQQVPILGAERWAERFDQDYWTRLADRCLSCRLCTYVCPTCRCFDVRDRETRSRGVERLRAWDSCMAESYRRIAGGHNPRPTKAERLRNRFYCKFCYYPQNYGPVACVGCGRCIAKCPVNVDAVEVLQSMAA